MLESENIDPNKLSFSNFTDFAWARFGIKKDKLTELSLEKYEQVWAEYQKYLAIEREKPQKPQKFRRDPEDPPPAYGFTKRKRPNYQGRTFND